jgi:16S rRNA G966 N2-methylase RsmD
LTTKVFRSNVADGQTILKHVQPQSVDIVFTDVPYGQHSQWQDAHELLNPISSILDILADILSPSSIVAIASDKGQKASHERYQRVEHFQIGKRRVVILKPV